MYGLPDGQGKSFSGLLAMHCTELSMFVMVLGLFQNRGDVNILNRIKDLIAVPMVFDQTCVAQTAQMVRHRRWRSIDHFGDFIDTPFPLR